MQWSLQAVRQHLCEHGCRIRRCEPDQDGNNQFLVYRIGDEDGGYVARDPETAYVIAIRRLF